MSIEPNVDAGMRDMLNTAVACHRAGDLRKAEELYERILAMEPDHAVARHHLGLLALAQGQASRALAELTQIASRFRKSAAFCHHLGLALSAAGQAGEACHQFREAIRLDPRYVDAYTSLGIALQSSSLLAEAKEAYRRALDLRPSDQIAQFNLGTVLQREGDYRAAEHLYRSVLQQVNHIGSHQGLGQCLESQGRLAEAIAVYESAIKLNPSSAELRYLLGCAWQLSAHPARAEACFRDVLQVDPRHVGATLALGVVAQSARRNNEARSHYRRVLELKPGDISAQFNLATVLYAEARYRETEAMCRDLTANANDARLWCLLSKCRLMQGDVDGALAHADQALAVDPTEPEGRLMRGTLLLTKGKWPSGWDDLRYCAELQVRPSPNFTQPLWHGEPLGDRTILVHGEYGFGDTLHFIRYLPLVRQRQRHCRVVVGVHPRLMPLLNTSGVDNLVALDGPLPPFDVRVGMMTLPCIFKTTLDTVPGTEPYLAADPHLVEHWHARLGDATDLRIGVHWQGDSTYLSDRHRSMPLSCFAPIARVPGVTMVSLQKGPGSGQIAPLADQFSVTVLDGLDEESGAFMDTAAVMKNLDLVITSDTAVAHLAGALGVPVWVALSAAPDWRWMIDRDDSPWYPSMRLFRQRTLDDWAVVFEEMASELRQMPGARHLSS